jgi:hypothetical protein
MLPLSRVVHFPLVMSTMEAAKSMLPSSSVFAVAADRQVLPPSGCVLPITDNNYLRTIHLTLALPSSIVPLAVRQVFPLAAGIATRNAMASMSPGLGPLRLSWSNQLRLNGSTQGKVSVATTSSHMLLDVIFADPTAVPVGGMASCFGSRVTPVPFASCLWQELSRIMQDDAGSDRLGCTGAGTASRRIVSSFRQSMDWDVEEVVAATDSSELRRFRPVRLTDRGQLVAMPVDSTKQEETLTAEYAC